MSKSFTGEHDWAELIEGPAVDRVPEVQRPAGIAGDNDHESEAHNEESFVPHGPPAQPTKRIKARLTRKAKRKALATTAKQRFGLPKGFAHSSHRFGRSILIECNIYRLPDGREFLPCHPTGTLGTRQHIYALLTVDQFLKKTRGSIYIRNDGRVFDYSVDNGSREGDIFDTGYTIYDLERTGGYAPSEEKKRKPAALRRRVASAG